MSLLDKFERARPPGQPPEFCQLRRVPIQPPGLPLGRIYLGTELGFASFSGSAPQPGDLVLVMGDSANRVALPQERPPPRNPIFSPDACRCTCPAETTGGLVFYLNSINWTPTLLVLKGADGSLVHRSLLPEVLVGEGIAVDPVPPHNLYVLDARERYTNLVTDLQPAERLATKNYWTLLTYALSGGAYALASVNVLPGGTGTFGGGDGPPLSDVANPLAVVDGEVWITRVGSPARFFRFSAGTFTSLTLQRDGAPYAAQPVGPVVMVPDKPASRTLRFVAIQSLAIASFTLEGEVQEVLEVPDAFAVSGLAVVCNRLLMMDRFGDSRDEDDGNFDLGGAGEGGDEEG